MKHIVSLTLLATLTVSSASADQSKPWRVGGGSTRVKAVGEVSRLVGSGWVRTTREYLDQDAEFDFRMPFPDSEGALWIRAVVSIPGDKPASGYRIALTNRTTGSGAVGSVKAVSGKLVGQQGPGSLVDDEWQHMKVHADGNEVTVTLNGTLLSTVKGQEYPVGYVGFEVSHGALDLRRIQLTALGDLMCRPEAALQTSDRRYRRQGSDDAEAGTTALQHRGHG